jgi:hypothetical protein
MVPFRDGMMIKFVFREVGDCDSLGETALVPFQCI